MLSGKFLIGIFTTSLWISCSFLFVTISCVYPSLWIDIIMIFIYLESYTLERSYIYSWYPYSFMSTFAWWLCERIYLEYGSYIVAFWCTLLWWRYVFSCLSWWGFCHFDWYPSSWQSYHFLSSPWVVTSVSYSFCIYSLLVNPFAWCVWEGHVMHLVSPLFKTILMLNAHPYISLLKCFAMTHTHHFGWAYS